MLSDEDLRRPSLRISLDYNSKEDIDALMDALKVFKYKICFVTLAQKRDTIWAFHKADFFTSFFIGIASFAFFPSIIIFLF
jgi:hypothetical protein